MNEEPNYDELTLISDAFENAFEEIFKEVFAEIGVSKLQDEITTVANAARWHAIGSITKSLGEAVAVLGSPQDVAKASLNVLGLHLPQLTAPSVQQVKLLLPKDSNNSKEEEEVQINKID